MRVSKNYVPPQFRTKLGKCKSCGKAGVGNIYDEDIKAYKVMCKYCKYIHLPNNMDLNSCFRNGLGEMI